WLNGLAFRSVDGGTETPVELPPGLRFLYPRFSPDGTRLAFVAEIRGALEVWVAERSGAARRLSPLRLNAAFGAPYQWAPDGPSLLIAAIPAGRGPAPAAPKTPDGPIVQENSGRATPARTYQGLLHNPHHEALFEHYFTAQIMRIDVASGAATPIGAPGLYPSLSTSPDGRYLLV